MQSVSKTKTMKELVYGGDLSLFCTEKMDMF